MKKFLLFAIAVATVAISCTKSEVVKAPGRGREITFDSYVGKAPVTKAESADLDYLKQEVYDEDGNRLENLKGGFQVYAFLHNEILPSVDTLTGEETVIDVSKVGTVTPYMNKTVNWVETVADDPETEADETEGKWDYPGVVYWPDHSTNRKLAFAAYALNAEKLMTFEDDVNTSTGKSYTKFSYTVPSAIADQKDLMVTPFLPNQGLDGSANTAPVQLNFKHLLSRVGFEVVANQGGDVVIDIQEVTMYGKFPKTGNVDLKGTGAIEPVTTGEGAAFEEEYTLFPGTEHFTTTSSVDPTPIYAKWPTPGTEPAGSVNNDASNRYMMIMPTTLEANVEGADPVSYIEVQYQLTDDEVRKARVSLDSWTFAPGKSYTFVFKISTTSIEFDVVVDSWTEFFEEKDEEGNFVNGNGVYTLIPIIEE